MDIANAWEIVRSIATPATTLSAGALLFTVASFWRLNATQGRLRAFTPRTFAAAINGTTRIRLPIVFYASGAKPIIIEDLRLTLKPTDEDALKFEWITVRSQLRPQPDDGLQFSSPFPVPGRSSQVVFVEFIRETSSLQLLQNPHCDATIEVLQGHRRKWRTLHSFRLYTENVKHPDSYITYRNGPL